MGKTNTTNASPLRPVPLRKMTHPTLFFPPHHPEETPLLNTELCFPAPNVPQVEAIVVTDHLIGNHCHGVSFLGQSLASTLLNNSQIPEDSVSWSPSPALQPESWNPCSLHPCLVNAVRVDSPTTGQLWNLITCLSAPQRNPAISFLLFSTPTHFAGLSISASPGSGLHCRVHCFQEE